MGNNNFGGLQTANLQHGHGSYGDNNVYHTIAHTLVSGIRITRCGRLRGHVEHLVTLTHFVVPLTAYLPFVLQVFFLSSTLQHFFPAEETNAVEVPR